MPCWYPSREAFVADVVQVLTTLTSQPVVLVEQSMGAHTAMLVAAAGPTWSPGS